MIENWILAGIIALVIGGGVLVGVAAFHDSKEHDRLMEQCLLDHKEYECVSLLKSGDSSAIIISPPIVVRGR